MLAFGAQECRQMALAEEQGMRALSDDMEDAWARETGGVLLDGRHWCSLLEGLPVQA